MELKDKVINFLGDSITEGCGTSGPDARFSALIEKRCGLKRANNYGISGTRIARQQVKQYGIIDEQDFCVRCLEMDKEADIIVVMGGTNDHGHGDAPIGVPEDRTPDTFWGACHTMMRSLLETYPNAPIMFKDTLFVDFLNLPKKHSEAKLKKGLVENMKQFILELGKDFISMDQEYRLQVGSSTYKADLLFYHRGLQALVAVELKKTKFHPRDLGQLEFYLEALDRDVKRSNENPSIGIILCPEADRVVVEYAMSRSMSPTMIAEYKRILIPQERLQQQLDEFCNLFLTKK